MVSHFQIRSIDMTVIATHVSVLSYVLHLYGLAFSLEYLEGCRSVRKEEHIEYVNMIERVAHWWLSIDEARREHYRRNYIQREVKTGF